MYNDNSIEYNIILNIINELDENVIMFTSIQSLTILPMLIFSRFVRLIFNFKIYEF